MSGRRPANLHEQKQATKNSNSRFAKHLQLNLLEIEPAHAIP